MRSPSPRGRSFWTKRLHSWAQQELRALQDTPEPQTQKWERPKVNSGFRLRRTDSTRDLREKRQRGRQRSPFIEPERSLDQHAARREGPARARGPANPGAGRAAVAGADVASREVDCPGGRVPRWSDSGEKWDRATRHLDIDRASGAILSLSATDADGKVTENFRIGAMSAGLRRPLREKFCTMVKPPRHQRIKYKDDNNLEEEDLEQRPESNCPDFHFERRCARRPARKGSKSATNCRTLGGRNFQRCASHGFRQGLFVLRQRLTDWTLPRSTPRTSTVRRRKMASPSRRQAYGRKTGIFVFVSSRPEFSAHVSRITAGFR